MTSSKKTVAPLIILALILAFICFLIWSALQAKNFGPRITDPDYYSKGLRYNTTLVEKRAASVLGWTISSSIRNGQLRVRLLDKQLRPVAKANGQLFLYQKKTSTLNLHLSKNWNRGSMPRPFLWIKRENFELELNLNQQVPDSTVTCY